MTTRLRRCGSMPLAMARLPCVRCYLPGRRRDTRRCCRGGDGPGWRAGARAAALSAHTDFRTWSDVASYRPPAALLGYHAATTERALTLIARTIAERDAEIEWLRERLAEASPDAAAGAGPEVSASPVRAGYPARQDSFGQDSFGQDPFGEDPSGRQARTDDGRLPRAGP